MGMGKKFDALFGRSFKASKFKSMANLAVSRIAILKNLRQVKCNQARFDVVQLLEQGHHDRALLRVEIVIKEQNMLDVFQMMESNFNLLIERVNLVEQDRECPGELKEAISSLMYASSRCGEFPELQEIRAVLTSWYGKEFVSRAIDLRNNCGVNLKMVQKLSTRQPNMESKMKVLKQIASENNIVLQLDEASYGVIEETSETSKQQNKPRSSDSTYVLSEEIEKDEFSDSMKSRKKYKDVADAAQAAFESAAYAATAARAAVELSRSNHPQDPGNQKSFNNQGSEASDNDESWKLESRTHEIRELKDSDSDSAEDEQTKDLATANSTKHIPPIIQAGVKDSGHGYLEENTVQGSAIETSRYSILEKKPFSVRTRGLRGY
ncbi:hypothetical protein K2173_017025 [Erythroxylum novogranatense]|uniref:IST1-like protein n=1 Tax=Erythroxylum novogranatense TaxID=1862640 RepID=A0AAV8U8S0_9ROSI|nr:hypothetical protein K2173_017025 [Erythroxylum novogranatense]